MSKRWKVLVSDTHYHNWSAFSGVGPDGVNTRLGILLASTDEAVDALLEKEGNLFLHGGDIFHVRGSVAPTVFNPVVERYTSYASRGVDSVLLAGNHDLEGRDSSSLSNAGQVLRSCSTIIDAPQRIEHDLYMIPWFSDQKKLIEYMKGFARGLRITRENPEHVDVVIHAPVNGVIKGIPDHGIEASELASIGFRRVFCGHYHDHKVMEGGKVISIGALTHQTWSDVGTRAGYILFNDDEVIHVETKAPKFLDLGRLKPEEYGQVSGNYVRIEAEIEKDSAIEELKDALRSAGAKGVVINPIRKKKEIKRDVKPASLATMEGSISAYVDTRFGGDESLKKLCMEILDEVEEV